MRPSSPSVETAHFVAKILSAYPVAVDEVAELVGKVASTIENLRMRGTPRPEDVSAAPAAPASPGSRAALAGTLARNAAKPAVRAVGRPAKARPVAATVAAYVPAPEAPKAVPLFKRAERQNVEITEEEAARITHLPPRRTRGERSTRNAAPMETMSEIEMDTAEIAAPTATPKLLRRAEAATAETGNETAGEFLARPRDDRRRGVVKWFDSRTGKGVLRLTGVSEDISLDAEALEQAGIKRLYKDQEVEAVIQGRGNRTKLVSLSLPGREAGAGTPSLTIGGLKPAGKEAGVGPRRPAKPITVEVKRETTGRRRSAREEAEHLFGNIGRPKSGR